MQVLFSNKKMTSFVRSNHHYNGGAHGMFFTAYSSIRLDNGQVISIADIFDTAAVRSKLSLLLEKKIRKEYELSDKEPLSEQLLVDKIPLTNNLLITSKRIGFNYTPYEIAPYAMGEIFVSFSFAELEPLLRPSFKSFLQQ